MLWKPEGKRPLGRLEHRCEDNIKMIHKELGWNNLAQDREKSYVVGSKSFRPDQLFKVTEIKQLCYFSS